MRRPLCDTSATISGFIPQRLGEKRGGHPRLRKTNEVYPRRLRKTTSGQRRLSSATMQHNLCSPQSWYEKADPPAGRGVS